MGDWRKSKKRAVRPPLKKPTADGGLTRYRDAVNYLRTYPLEKERAYLSPGKHPASCLFQFCTPDGRARPLPDGRHAGDPLMIARRPQAYGAWVAADEVRVAALKLPGHPEVLEDSHLVSLAYFQRHLDESIRCYTWRRDHRGALVEAWYSDFWNDDQDEIW